MSFAQTDPKKLRLWLSVVLILGIFSLLIFVAYQQTRFRIVEITPDINTSVATSTVRLDIKFDRPLATDSATLDSIDSNGLVTKVRSADDTLTLHLRELEKDRDYLITLQQVRSQNGDLLQKVELSFSTEYIPYSELSEAERQQQIAETDPEIINPTIHTYLPYHTETYSLIAAGAVNSSSGKPLAKPVALVTNVSLARFTTAEQAAELPNIAQTIKAYLADTGIGRSEYLLITDNQQLKRYIKGDTLPAGFELVSDDFTGDGVPPEER